MTALKISLEKGKKASYIFALGVSLIVFSQAYIAIILTKYIAETPTILETLEKAGIVVFLFLAYYFYKQSKKGKIQIDISKAKKENTFLEGITLSVLNMFSIPFYCGIVIALDAINMFNFNFIPVLFFNLGSVIGTFFILFLYGKFAKWIQKNTGKLTKDINIILSFLTALVAVIAIIKIFF